MDLDILIKTTKKIKIINYKNIENLYKKNV